MIHLPRRKLWSVLVLAALIAAPALAAAQSASATQGPILFAGSSTIELWNLDESFPGLKTINKGVGGSQFSDSLRWEERDVIAYKPRIVVVYSGDNDIATGATPQEVAARFEQFATKLHTALPRTRLVVISVKPSILRWALVDKMRAANTLIKAYVAQHDYIEYVDIDPLMVGSDGKPRRELFVADGLHMTPEGYKIWNAAVLPHLK